jgi:chromosome segregation protein
VVRCEDPLLADLPARLLTRTLILRDLAAARAVAALQRGYRCITLQGELIDADGTLTVGTHHAEAGILSRKSELRELREQVAVLDLRLAELERDLGDLRERLAVLDGRIENQEREIEVLGEQAGDMRLRLSQQKDRRAGLHDEVEVSRSEINVLEEDIRRLGADWHQASDQAAQAEVQVQKLQAGVEAAEREIREREEQRQHQQQQATAAKVTLAQAKERLDSLLEKQQKVEDDLRQRQQERQERAQHLQTTRSRLGETQRNLLASSSALASAYLHKEEAERRLAELAGEREGVWQQRQHRLEQTQSMRAARDSQQDQAHTRELEVNRLRHELDTQCARLQEDYQLDLAALYRDSTAALGEGGTLEILPRPAGATGTGEDPAGGSNEGLSPKDEIDELRRKLSRLGSVNLEAIQELQDLEARASTLRIQYDDLAAAQQALKDIIARINTDSRRLFGDTFATIRTHFQELFRKLFGGGMADVVLEDETDILESGIEVIARPPGKELRSISLMSGGEKTMTAVALLLAIFRSKPSPFCILDEVDAALDEANISRFTAVLRDYLDRSQFILITHSKRTMACADVLYGVTMQESGISRRIAVRFEDWEEESPDSAANQGVA